MQLVLLCSHNTNICCIIAGFVPSLLTMTKFQCDQYLFLQILPCFSITIATFKSYAGHKFATSCKKDSLAEQFLKNLIKNKEHFIACF